MDIYIIIYIYMDIWNFIKLYYDIWDFYIFLITDVGSIEWEFMDIVLWNMGSKDVGYIMTRWIYCFLAFFGQKL
jgi:hypothetical protein